MRRLGVLAPPALPRPHGVRGQQGALPIQPIRASSLQSNYVPRRTWPTSCSRQVVAFSSLGQQPVELLQRLHDDARVGQHGMKLVSPDQRGTMCQCRWPGKPAPATRPRFRPMLKPSGFIRSRRRRPRRVSWLLASRGSRRRRARAIPLVAVRGDQQMAVVVRKAIEDDDRLAAAPGNEVFAVVALGQARQMKQGSCSAGGLAEVTYERRHGAHKRSMRWPFETVIATTTLYARSASDRRCGAKMTSP